LGRAPDQQGAAVKWEWLSPTEGSWLARFMAGEKKTQWRPGAFLCGVRTDSAGVPGVAREWRYRMSSIEGDVLLFGRQRLAVQLVSAAPIDAWVEPRDNFMVFAAVERESGQALELSVDQRDAYLLTESSLADRA
jgi:hypothetical protein